jgi:hypothetical protein
VVRRAAREDDHAAEVPNLLVRHPELLELEPAVAHAPADRLGDGLRLLVDLLEHERLVAALLGGLEIPVDLGRRVLERLLAVGPREDGAFGRDRDDVAVVDQLHHLRLGQERGDRRREEHLAFADADDERALLPRPDEQSRVVVVDDDEREVALELAVRLVHGVDEVALVVLLDEMHDDLGVGLRRERVPVGDQRVLELAVVLDDPVEDDCDLRVVARRERMRVLLGDAAVRRPARVAEAGRRLRAVRAGDFLQLLKVAHRADVVEPVFLEQRDPGGVVAAVLEALETL